MIKFLVNFTISLNIHGPLLCAVLAAPIQHIDHSVAQVLGTGNPRKFISIQSEGCWCESKIASCEYNSFGLAFTRFWISAERDLMLMYILLGQVQHLLESTPRGTGEQEIISIPYTASIVVTDESTTLVLLEYGKETVHIKIKEDRGNHCTLSDSISIQKLENQGAGCYGSIAWQKI